jgi:hypothetical protein
MRGNLAVAKWIHTIRPSLDNYVKHAFNDACEHGHLEVAQWLMEIGNDDDACMYYIDNYLFALVCNNGHLEVARWLYEISLTSDIPWVDPEDHTAFRWACEMGHLHVAQWIALLVPHMYIITDIYSDPIKHQIIHQLYICEDDVITRNKKDADADECIICQQDKPDLMSDCNHTYCEDCIQQWFNHSDQETCPCCRRDIESFQRIVYCE